MDKYLSLGWFTVVSTVQAHFSHEIVPQEQDACYKYRFQKEIFESFIEKTEKDRQMSVHLGVIGQQVLEQRMHIITNLQTEHVSSVGSYSTFLSAHWLKTKRTCYMIYRWQSQAEELIQRITKSRSKTFLPPH